MAPGCGRLPPLVLCLAVLATHTAAWVRPGGCYAPNCQTCQSGRPYQCSVCKLGYQKAWGNTCSPCTRTGQTAQACKTYAVANACACKECNPGYGPTPNLSGQCMPCAVTGCSRFSAGCTCSQCRSGYTSNESGGCTKCTEAGQTLAECAAYEAGTCTCTRCKPGFSLDAATGSCVACSEAGQTLEECKTFALNTCTCTACQPGYGPVTDGACSPCTDPIPVEECAAFGSVPGQRGVPALGSCACSVCAAGYARVSTGDCMQCTAEGQNAESCLGFERNSCRCTQCAPKFGPLTRDKRCPPNDCDEAHDAVVCKAYKYGVPCFCTACNPGYTLSNGACVPCTDPARDTECTTYSPYPVWGWNSKGSCTCAVCAPGFSRNYYGDCVACTGTQAATNCAEYVANTCRCKRCKPGFGPLTGQGRCPACTNPTASECTEYAATPAPGPGSLGTCSCQTCAANFKRNVNTGDCDACVNGWEKVGDACQECKDNPNCVTFVPGSCDCTETGCKPGYEGAKCTECKPANCDASLPNACDGCLTCDGGYSLDDLTKACEDCQKPTCATFTPNTCQCLTCQAGYEGADCDVCVNGWEKVGDVCQECKDNPNCGTFAAETCDCTQCDSGFALDGTGCTACPDGQDPALCESYDDAGVTCVCTACKDEAYMVANGACVPKATLTVATSSDVDSIAVTVGEDVLLTVTVSNEGSVGATGVTFAFTPPADVAWTVDAADKTCTLDGATGEYTCALGDLAGSESAGVTITGTPASAGSLEITGVVAATNVETCSPACAVSVSIEVTEP